MKPKDEYKDYGTVRINSKGKCQLNMAYTEITRLHVMLEDNRIPHLFRRLYDGWQVCYPEDKERKISAVQHCFSYGAHENRIEIAGGITPADGTSDIVLGHLTAEDVFGRIVTMYKAASAGTNAERCVCHEADPFDADVCIVECEECDRKFQYSVRVQREYCSSKIEEITEDDNNGTVL